MKATREYETEVTLGPGGYIAPDKIDGTVMYFAYLTKYGPAEYLGAFRTYGAATRALTAASRRHLPVITEVRA